jgi:hypothetical protein
MAPAKTKEAKHKLRKQRLNKRTTKDKVAETRTSPKASIWNRNTNREENNKQIPETKERTNKSEENKLQKPV